MSLEGKTALITGAASGIGRAMARVFCAQGAAVLAVDRDPERLGKVIDDLRDQERSVQPLVVDLGDPGAADEVHDAAMDQLDHVDILCNNAGVLDDLTPLHACDDELWKRVMGINLDTPFRLLRRFLPHMVERGSGAIVNTASAAAEHGGRGGAAYTASKHALAGLTRSVAWYYGPQGIRCNAVAPGSVLTRMQNMQPHAEGLARYQPYFQTIPHGRAVQIAQAAAWLASEEASFVNGAILPVDGGWTTY